jgi:CTP:molybdopterin cytidylyltransferase MocA
MAAGGSRRLGARANKLLLAFRGRPLLQHAIDAASQSQVISCTLVVGANAREVLDSVDVRRSAVVDNPKWREGIASSIRAGLAQHRDDEACIFMVADQPFIGAEDINRLIAHHHAARDAIIAVQAGEVWGTPMLFPAHDFDALSKLHGDSGAKRVAEAQRGRLRFVAALSHDAFKDVDTIEDYDRITGGASGFENPKTPRSRVRKSLRRR